MLKVFTSIVGLLTIAYCYHKKQLVSSVTMWVFAYLLIFIVCPLYGNEQYRNSELIDYCAFGGILAFVGGLFVVDKSRYRIRIGRSNEHYSYNNDHNQKKYIAPDYRVARLAFLISFIFSIVALLYLIGTEGIKAIISGLTTSKKFALAGDRSNTIYVFSVHLMVPCVLAMWMSAKEKKEKVFRVVALAIYVLETVLFGFTRIFLISILAIIFIYEIRNFTRKKQFIYLILGIIGLIFSMVFLNLIRTWGMGRIGSFSSKVDLEYLFTSTDFRASYHWFDELLDYPSPHISPIVYLKPVFMLIPRSFWPSKPEPLSLQVLKYLNPSLVARGYSTAGNSVLGEGYALLGYIGMFLSPFIWGVVCGIFDRGFYSRQDKEDASLRVIFYYIFAVFVVINGQRGDWSQYMGIVCWFYFLPLYFMSKITIKYYDSSM